MPRQSAAVYRRRRLVLFGGLIVVVVAVAAGVWLAVAQPWASATQHPTSKVAKASNEPTPTPTAETPDPSSSPSPSTSATPEPSATPSVVACEATDIEVAAVTDADTYRAGVLPKLSIALKNTGNVDCTIDVGSATQVFTVTSGTDVWWRSTDCQKDPSSMVVTLTAGKTVTSKTPVVWDRTRSRVETCDEKNRQRAPAGGASYHVEVSIGGFTSVMTKQILLY